MFATRYRPLSRTRVPAANPASSTFERLLIAALAAVAVLHSLHHLVPEAALVAALPGPSLARVETAGNVLTLVLAVVIYSVMARRLRNLRQPVRNIFSV